jgi:hypothetical protein
MKHGTIHALGTLAVSLAMANPSATPLVAQSSTLDRLSIHGFLTQAYGISDGHQYLGIPSHGTADYRSAALLFRYDATDRDVFAVQFSHERLGLSPLGALVPEVDIDWIFYEHRFGDHTVARVGKIKSPLGIYNEIRDVGTLLPLYRPPLALYGEEKYRSETVDGVMVGHRVPLGSWELEVDGFFGSWGFAQYDNQTIAEVSPGAGAQVWLQTPLDGLRVGGAALRLRTRNTLGTPPDFEDDQFLWHTAVDGTFSRFFVRGESFRIGFGATSVGYKGHMEGYYGEAGLALTEKTSLIGQAEWLAIAIDVAEPPQQPFDVTVDRTYTLGVRYQPTPTLAFKAEAHRYRGYSIEDELLLPGLSDPANVTYWLFGVSTSF